MARMLFCVLFVSVCSGAMAQSDTGAQQIELSVRSDWEAGEVTFSLRAPIGRYILQDNAAPAYAANRRWRARLDEIIPRVLEHIPYDGTHTLLSAAEQRGISQRVVEDMVREVRLTYNGLSADFTAVEARYRLQFYPSVIAHFPTASQAVAERYNWIATTDYSGIVVIARGALPLHNDARTTRAQPALSPTIYDEQLRVVLEAAMVESAVKEQRGVVGYDSEYSATKWRWRIGINPLLLYARGVQDERGTNLIISNRDAQKVLTREHNRNLIRNGKILVVLDEAIAINTLTINTQ